MSRILLTGFCALPGPDRAGVQMRYVLEALSRHHTVDALVIRHAEQAYVERMGTARILRVPLHDDDLSARIETFRRALKRQIEGAEYDIVHVRDGWAGVTVLELQSLFGYQVIFDAARAPVADAPLMDATLSAELGRAEQRCLAHANRVLVPTEDARSYLAGNRGGVHVVPPGVNVDHFDWDEPELGLPIVLFAGTIEPGRGIRVLVRAMAHVLRDMDARLIIAGALDKSFQKSLEFTIRELGLEHRVELRGEVDHSDMPELIARSTVCVAPSASESRTQPMALYPTKILEFMACRRAVVAPRRGTTAMLIRHRTHGLLFSPGDPEDLARTLVTALRDHDLRGRLANAGYQLVRQFHTASSTRRILRQLYRELSSGSAAVEPAYSQVATDENQKLAQAWNDAREITETNSLPGVLDPHHTAPEPRFTSVETDSFTPVTTTAPPDPRSTLEMEMPIENSWAGGETDETEIPTPVDTVLESDEWVVPAWDSTGWKSLLDPVDDGTPLDGVHVPPDVGLDGTFAAGEISVDTPPPDLHAESEPSFTAVSVLLGAIGEDTGSGTSE